MFLFCFIFHLFSVFIFLPYKLKKKEKEKKEYDISCRLHNPNTPRFLNMIITLHNTRELSPFTQREGKGVGWVGGTASLLPLYLPPSSMFFLIPSPFLSFRFIHFHPHHSLSLSFLIFLPLFIPIHTIFNHISSKFYPPFSPSLLSIIYVILIYLLPVLQSLPNLHPRPLTSSTSLPNSTRLSPFSFSPFLQLIFLILHSSLSIPHSNSLLFPPYILVYPSGSQIIPGWHPLGF